MRTSRAGQRRGQAGSAKYGQCRRNAPRGPGAVLGRVRIPDTNASCVHGPDQGARPYDADFPPLRVQRLLAAGRNAGPYAVDDEVILPVVCDPLRHAAGMSTTSTGAELFRGPADLHLSSRTPSVSLDHDDECSRVDAGHAGPRDRFLGVASSFQSEDDQRFVVVDFDREVGPDERDPYCDRADSAGRRGGDPALSPRAGTDARLPFFAVELRAAGIRSMPGSLRGTDVRLVRGSRGLCPRGGFGRSRVVAGGGRRPRRRPRHGGFSLGAVPAQRWPRTAPARRGRCCSTRPFRSPSSATPGRRATRSRST